MPQRRRQKESIVCAFTSETKSSGKTAESSKEDNKDKGRFPKPEVTPKPKPKPEAKPKAEAKAAVAGLLGVDLDVGPRASSIRVMAKAAPEIDQSGTSEHASDSEGGSRLSSDSTGRVIEKVRVRVDRHYRTLFSMKLSLSMLFCRMGRIDRT